MSIETMKDQDSFNSAIREFIKALGKENGERTGKALLTFKKVISLKNYCKLILQGSKS